MTTNQLKIIIPNPAASTRIRVKLDQPGQNINRIRINVVRSTSYITTTVNVVSTVCNKAQYPFGFNGQMKVDEVAGKGNHNTSKFDEYDPRIARRWERDPKAGKMPGWSPYSINLDNPILNLDKDGDFPYSFHIRSFAPFKQFGGWFDGDNRGYSTVLGKSEIGPAGVTSRMQQAFTVDPAKGTLTGGKPWSDPSHHPWFGTKTATDEGGVSADYLCINVKNIADIKADMAGANPLVKFSPNIDVHSSIRITENVSAGLLSVDATMRGDKFPAAEMFIGDSKGQQIMVIASPYQGNPYENLPFDNDRYMGSGKFDININNKGEFMGVTQADKTYSPAAWNKMMSSQPIEQPKEKPMPPR